MKRKFALTMLALVLAVSSVQAQKPKNISEAQCRNIFPSADDYQNRCTADGTPYCEAYRDRDDDPRVLLGYLVLKTLTLPEREMGLLVGVNTNGRIVKVETTDPTVVTEEFLAQFAGRSVNANFEVAKTADDLLYLPSKIKAIQDNLEMSERIAETVHQAMLFANSSLSLGLEK